MSEEKSNMTNTSVVESNINETLVVTSYGISSTIV